MCLEALGGRASLFSWERLRGGLKENIASCIAVPEVLNMKCRSEVKHGFTNRGCLDGTILKALNGFKGEKKAHMTKDMEFFLQNEIFKILKLFKNNMKFTGAAS